MLSDVKAGPSVSGETAFNHPSHIRQRQRKQRFPPMNGIVNSPRAQYPTTATLPPHDKTQNDTELYKPTLNHLPTNFQTELLNGI